MNFMKEHKAATINRRKYDEDFKRSAMKMINNGQSVRSVAQSLGVAEGLLHRWKRTAQKQRSPDEQEVSDLRVRLRQVEMERDILKKALCIFSRMT